MTLESMYEQFEKLSKDASKEYAQSLSRDKPELEELITAVYEAGMARGAMFIIDMIHPTHATGMP